MCNRPHEQYKDAHGKHNFDQRKTPDLHCMLSKEFFDRAHSFAHPLHNFMSKLFSILKLKALRHFFTLNYSTTSVLNKGISNKGGGPLFVFGAYID